MRIPKGSYENDALAPAWIPVVDSQGRTVKPVIRCACGRLASIRLHHLHADGRVTASFLEHSCGFHEFLELDGWSGGEFPPEPR